MTATPKSLLHAEAGRVLIRALYQLRVEFQETVDGLRDITAPVAGALLLLDESMPMNELARRIGCDPSYVTVIADRLEELGLANRHPWPQDRRVKQLVLTEKGKKRAEELADLAFRTSPFLKSLDENEIRALVRILGKTVS
ncbi:MAG TPA: MarR family transcriptional regulator [Acidimicrobiia bacterium]|jgi:DNA-binding MarR family transcriptional regulator